MLTIPQPAAAPTSSFATPAISPTPPLAPRGQISLEALKSASLVALADTISSPTADPREKRLAIAVFFRYLATVESRDHRAQRDHSGHREHRAPNAPAAYPAPRAPSTPLIPERPAEAPLRAPLSPHFASLLAQARAGLAAQSQPRQPQHQSQPPRAASPPTPSPAPPALTLVADTPSPAAQLRARAGIAPTNPIDPTAPHAGVNFHPKVHPRTLAQPTSIPRAPPAPTPHAAPHSISRQLAAAA